MMFDRDHILAEIRRTAVDGVALGRHRFERQTGIKVADWQGKFWAKWSDAVAEAGLTVSKMQGRIDDEVIFEQLALLIRDLGSFPTQPEMKLRRQEDDDFPSVEAIRHRGTKKELIAKVTEFCETRAGFDDVRAILEPLAAENTDATSSDVRRDRDEIAHGYVYLLKSGKYYKIGRSNSTGRREYELGIQLPEEASLVHEIKTDDPVGIERYWHERFASRRIRGEWFDLEPDDVRVFKRRKFM